jgi:glycosyltransferase involved in cell wall biosynthesis
VVTVTFNAAKDLPRLIESLRRQTDRDFKFVVIDGGSKDGTQDIVAAAADIVTYSRSEPDNGFFDALNKAVKVVETDYYIVMGADDTLFPDTVAGLKGCAAATEADMVVAGVKAGKRVLSGYHLGKRWLGPGYMFTSHSVGTLIRMRLHERFGFYSYKYPIYADSLFMKRVAISPDTKVVDTDLVAGEFCIVGGFSSANYVRACCELWMVQRETGENPLLQWLLFQGRLLKNLARVLRRP